MMKPIVVAALAIALTTVAVSAQQSPPRTVTAATGTLRVETVATGIRVPWSLVFLPNVDMLVSESQPPRLRRVSRDGGTLTTIEGLPAIHAHGHGGLLGLALDPAFGQNRRVYFAYSEAGEGKTSGLAVARAKLRQDRLEGVEVIWRQTPKVADNRNFGGRLAFAPDGMLFVMTGNRFANQLVQDRANTIGALVRIAPNGDVPPDNPFVGLEGVDPTIWSWGHRNIEGGAFHPQTGRLWIHEFGPRGGDELNIAEAGRNYGWPLVSWGKHYSGKDIPDPPTRPHLAESVYHWIPVISPSGMVFYDGSAIPEWAGNLIIGGLSSTDLIRLTLHGERVISEERIDFGGRIRDVAQGPDGALYLLTDQPKGEILRVFKRGRGGQ